MGILPGDGYNRIDLRGQDRDARMYAAAEKHRLIKEGAEGDAAYDGSAPKRGWLARLIERLGSRRADG